MQIRIGIVGLAYVICMWICNSSNNSVIFKKLLLLFLREVILLDF